MKRERGSITVFICILLSVLIPLSGILMDLARYNEAVKIAESSVRLCAESMLAAYDRQMKEQFGLLAMHPRDAVSLEKEIYELLSDNLTPEDAGGSVTDLYRFKVRRVEVIPIYNLSEPYVLEQHIAEFMKYRAPIQAVGEFLEKLKSMTSLAKEGEIVERNMTLDKLLNGLRKGLIYFSLLMNRKMENINKNNGMDNLAYWTLLAVESNNEKEQESRPDQKDIDDINNKMAEYRNAMAERNEAYAVYDNARNEFKSVESRMKDLQEQLSQGKKSSGESEEGEGKGDEQDSTSDSSQDSIIKSLEEEINKLQPEYDGKKSAMESSWNTYSSLHDKMVIMGKTLDTFLERLLNRYKAMYYYTSLSTELLFSLKNHLLLHESYCAHAIDLGQNIVTQAQQIQEEKKDLEGTMNERPDSAVAQQIDADLEKKFLSVDPQHLGQIIGQLENNKIRVSAWRFSVEAAYNSYLEIDMALDAEIKKIEGLINDKGDGGNIITMYTGTNYITSYHYNLTRNLKDMDTYSNMKTRAIYVIPEYRITPPATEKEQEAFDIWHANTFEEGSLGQHEEPENPGLANARKKTGDTAEAIAGDQGEENAAEAGDGGQNGQSNKESIVYKAIMEGEFLPSHGGSSSSEKSLARISEHVWQTQTDQFVINNPLQDPIEGADTVNEEDKGFFDNALERIRKFFGTIGQLLKGAGESLVKSLYMNEYIVSAFKNYTTVGNVLEHDIGWLRPLDKSFFDRAEVEYIVFGQFSEESNIAAAKRSITIIRLVFNLLHVYTDPQKLASTFNLASTIAGWTIIGVPIVQNFLLISWAAAESWLDAEKLMAGEQVPLIKTSKSWFLDWDTLYDYLISNVIGSVKDFVADKAGEIIDEGAKYLEETVMAFINSQLDDIFSGITETWCEAAETVSQEAETLVNSIDFSDMSNIAGETVESFLESLREYMVSKLVSFCESIRDKGSQVITDCKKALLDKISNFLFSESSAFSRLKEKVKDFAKDTIEKGFDAVTNKISGVLGGSGGNSSGATNVLGRLIMMDYVDYLRLLLLTVTPEQKALRCADLIQVDMKTALPDNANPIKDYHTALYVKAWIDIDLWVIPEEWFKKDKEAMIVVEWAQGY